MLPIVLLISTILLNIPFGMLRVRERKFSWRWFLWVHMPVPIIIAGRLLCHIDSVYIPLLVLSALAGQYVGGQLGRR